MAKTKPPGRRYPTRALVRVIAVQMSLHNLQLTAWDAVFGFGNAVPEEFSLQNDPS